MPQSSQPTPSRATVLCVSRYLAFAGVSGHNVYLREVVEGLRAAGYSVTYLWLDGPLFHRPWWRMPANAVHCDRLVSCRGFQVGRWIFATEAGLWLAGLALVTANRSLRLLPFFFAPQFRRVKAWAEKKFEVFRRPLESNIAQPSALETARFQSLLHKTTPLAVLLNYAYLAPLSPVARELGFRSAVLTHDVVHQLHATMQSRGLGGTPTSAEAEAGQLKQADLVVAIQPDEAVELQRMLPQTSVITVPMPLPLATTTAIQEPATLLFVGSGTGPNLDGLSWFLQKVWSLVSTACPQTRLRVCGSVCNQLAEVPPGVELAGMVPDLGPEYSRATLCIAPLLCGSGLKIKVVEAWAHSRTVVGTPVAMQGLAEYAGRCTRLAATPDEFASAIIDLLENAGLRQRLEAEAARVAEEKFSPSAALSPLVQWIASGSEKKPGESRQLDAQSKP